MKLVFIHGAPGVGKLTVARALHKLTGYPVFHNHLVIDMLAQVLNTNSPNYIKLREQMWLQVFRAASQDRLPGLTFTFVYESSTLTGFFDRVRECLAPNDEFYAVELCCELPENERRLNLPDRYEFLKLSTTAYLREWVLGGHYARPPGLPESRLIDTTLITPEETAALIFEHVGASPRT
jgi:hypothetical protein